MTRMYERKPEGWVSCPGYGAHEGKCGRTNYSARGLCGACTQRRRTELNPDGDVSARLKRRYSMTLEEYKALIERQAGKCQLCARKLTFEIGRSSTRAVVDHCHKTKAVRGILCQRCNVAVGFYERIKSEPDWHAAIDDYLRR